MVIFHSYVSLPEGKWSLIWLVHVSSLGTYSIHFISFYQGLPGSHMFDDTGGYPTVFLIYISLADPGWSEIPSGKLTVCY